MSAGGGLEVVIPVLDRWAQTERCIQSLLAAGLAPDRIIVVDHGSTDGTAEHLAHTYPRVIRLDDDPQHWWAGATNRGIRHALARGAASVMLLNNDCRLEPGTLDRLQAHGADHPGAVIAPVQRDPAGQVRVARATTLLWLGFPTLVLPWHRRLDAGHALLPTRLIVGGRGVIVPRAVFETVGVFDDAALPHYGADHDFYLRCRRHGVALWIAADCSVVVDDAGAEGERDPASMTWKDFRQSLARRRSHRNIADVTAFFRRHYPVPALYPLGVALFFVRYILRYLAARLARRLSVGAK
jgi:GT2 family glycosyltransferase